MAAALSRGEGNHPGAPGLQETEPQPVSAVSRVDSGGLGEVVWSVPSEIDGKEYRPVELHVNEKSGA